MQTRDNHTRWHAPFHFFLAPISIIVLIWSIVLVVRQPSQVTALVAVLAFLLVVTATLARMYAIKVQDRVIRLEERLRIQHLCSSQLAAQGHSLSESQLIALRFASDAEVPSLVAACVSEKLDRKNIKARIQDWRPDEWRV